MNKIRKGDEVIVITGRDKGKRGKVAVRADDSHLLIDGINVVKKHTKCHSGMGIGHHKVVWCQWQACSHLDEAHRATSSNAIQMGRTSQPHPVHLP